MNVAVILVADLADDSAAIHLDQAILAGGQTDLSVVAFLCHQLRLLAGCAHQLRAAAHVELNAGDDGAHGDVGDGEAVAGLDVGAGAGLHHVTGLQADGGDDIGLLAVLILDQGDVGAAVGVVLRRRTVATPSLSRLKSMMR